MSRERSIWLDCAHPGCSTGTYADARHLTNICASGGWYCGTHNREDEE
jgi:hypothetical protein